MTTVGGRFENVVDFAFASCHPATIHPRMLFEPLLAQIDADNDTSMAKKRRKKASCDSLSDFVERLRRRPKPKPVVLVLRKAEKLRDLDANLLPAFLRLGELISAAESDVAISKDTSNICVVLLASIGWSKFGVSSGHIVPVTLPVYTEKELATIIAEKLKDAASGASKDEGDKLKPEFYLRYAYLILSYSLASCNSLPRLLWIAALHFDMYAEPALSGAVEPDNVRALYRRIEKPLRESLGAIHLRELNNLAQTRRLHVELPFHAKFLLIAAYLASYNPVKSDKRFFVKHHGKQRNTKTAIRAKENRISSQLTGPKPFPLDRLLAIFYSILDSNHASSANVLSQITSLVNLQFMTLLSSEEGGLDQPKYKCTVSLSFIEQLSKQVGFEVHKFLYDFV